MKKGIIFIIAFFVFGLSLASAQSLGTDTEPPRLRDLEPIVVQVIYVIWGLGTLGLTLVLMLIGFRYMTSMGDAQKQQEIREGANNWLISLLIFFLAYPVILGVYNITGIGGDSSCYEDISTPGFKFFFPTVCTDPQAESDKFSPGNNQCESFNQEELDIMKSKNVCCDSQFGTTIEVGICYEVVDSGANTFYTTRLGIKTDGDCQVGGAPSTTCDEDSAEYRLKYNLDKGVYEIGKINN